MDTFAVFAGTKSRRGIRRTQEPSSLILASFGGHVLLGSLSSSPRLSIDWSGRVKLVFVTPVEDGTARTLFWTTLKRGNTLK